MFSFNIFYYVKLPQDLAFMKVSEEKFSLVQCYFFFQFCNFLQIPKTGSRNKSMERFSTLKRLKALQPGNHLSYCNAAEYAELWTQTGMMAKLFFCQAPSVTLL